MILLAAWQTRAFALAGSLTIPRVTDVRVDGWALAVGSRHGDAEALTWRSRRVTGLTLSSPKRADAELSNQIDNRNGGRD